MATIFAFYIWVAHWRHLKNTTEPSMCGSDAALCQITLTTCFFVVAAAYNQLFCELMGKYLLVSELHNTHIIRWVFWQQFSVAESCMRSSLFMQFLSMTISSRHSSQGRVTTRLGCGGIFNYYFYCKFITESNSERILKIGQDLTKLPPWVSWSSLLVHIV